MPRPAKHSFAIKGHRTSISLEPEFWDGLREIAEERRMSLGALVAEIDAERAGDDGLSSAVRRFVLAHYRERARGVHEVGLSGSSDRADD